MNYDSKTIIPYTVIKNREPSVGEQ
jgi:hypothetical protein